MSVSQKQLAANRRNWAKRGPLTASGRCRLSAAARRNKPWQHSTGPRTAAGKERSRTNALKTGEASAQHRAMRAYFVVIRRFMTMHFFINAQLDRRDRGSAFFCRYVGTLADFVIANRRLHLHPPESRDVTACTEWLATHKWLGEQPVEHGDIPMCVLCEGADNLLALLGMSRIEATYHIVAAMIGRRGAALDLGYDTRNLSD